MAALGTVRGVVPRLLAGGPYARRVCGTFARMYHDSLFRNSGALMLTTAITSLLGYGYWVCAAHLYAPDEIGVATATLALIGLASNLLGGGVAAAVVQRLPRCAPGSAWSSAVVAALLIGMIAALFAALLMGAVIAWLPGVRVRSWHGTDVALLLGSAPIWTAGAVLDATFVAQRRAERMLARNVACALAKIPLMAAPAILGTATAPSLVCSWTVATAASALVAAAFLTRELRVCRPAVRQLGVEGRALLRSLGGQQWIGLGGMAWMYLLPVLVTARRSAAENAYSSVTWMSGGLLFMVSSAVSLALFAEGAHTPRDLVRLLRAGIRIVVALLTPAILLCVLTGGRLLALFGSEYARHGATLLLVLALAAVPDAITNLAVGAWRVQGRLARATVLNLGMAVLALLLAWLWLPRFGMLGAGMAWLIAQSLGGIAVLLTLRGSPPGRQAGPW